MSNTRELTSSALETLYRVMLKRISKRLSAEKLSFLIGRPADYVSNIEMLHTRPYSIPELKCVAAALEENDYRVFFTDVDHSTIVNAMMELEISGKKLMHTCSIINGEQEKTGMFQLQEDAAAEVHLIDNYTNNLILAKEDIKIARDAVKLLISADYFFEPRLPVHIYQSINNFLKTALSPAYIEEALNSFCKGKNTTILKREEKSKHGFYYVAA